MKRYIYLSLFLLSSLCFFTACSDDNGSNPTVRQPGTFVLNTPSYSSCLVDLLNTETLQLSTSQPDYGYTAAVVYRIQVSLTDSWNVSYDEAKDDETGETIPDYATVDESYNKVKISASTALVDEAIMKVGGWESVDQIPESQEVYLRLQASLANYATGVESHPCYSNSVKLNVEPYFMELKGKDPVLWYLVGSCVGDGSWKGDVGVAFYPMSVAPEATFDKNGYGELTSIAYLTTKGFKLVQVPGEWQFQWGQGDSWGEFKYCEGGSANITVPADGYYTINLNTATNELTIEEYSEAVTVYPEMFVSGSFNEWATDTKMTPVNTYEGAVNHIWTYDIESDGAVELKFLADSGWATNWGVADQFPYGYGEQNGKNIVVAEGSWTIFFNDIDGSYEFVAKE